MTDGDWIPLADLHRLRWSNRLAWHLLGMPDRAITHAPFPKQPSRQLYRRERVVSASRPEDRRFQELRLSDLLRHMTRIQIGLDEALRWAGRVRISSSIPQVSWDELRALGMEQRRQLHGDWVPTREAEDMKGLETLAAYVYLKHECTSYDELCRFIRGRPFARFTYPVIMHRVNRLVLDAHPECLPRVKGASGNSRFTCRRCGRSGQGRYNGHYFEKPDRWVQQLGSQGQGIWSFCGKQCSLPGSARGDEEGEP